MPSASACANLVAVLGRAPEAWIDLPDPDAIFVGGSGREISRLLDLAYERLRPADGWWRIPAASRTWPTCTPRCTAAPAT